MMTLIFDTETNGLIKNKLVPLASQPQVIEYFGLTIVEDGDGWTESGSYECLINPGKPLPAEIFKITGINDEMLKDAPPFREVAVAIKEHIESHDEVVAHNLSYDKAMIDFEMSRCGLKVNWPRLICTVESTIHFKGHRLSLTALHEYLFGEGFKGAHRAETDVRALARCYVELKKRGVV